MIQERDGRTIVKCDSCGRNIDFSGTMCTRDETELEPHGTCSPDNMLHFCDDCSTPANQEMRICQHCGKPIIGGFTVGGGFWYCCENCFETWMNENCPGGWRQVDDDGCYGYYEELIDGEWVGTGIYYTEWY